MSLNEDSPDLDTKVTKGAEDAKGEERSELGPRHQTENR